MVTHRSSQGLGVTWDFRWTDGTQAPRGRHGSRLYSLRHIKNTNDNYWEVVVFQYSNFGMTYVSSR